VRIFLSRLHFPVTSLGFGRRVGVWFQGCSIRCPGCVSVDTWVAGRGSTTVDAVVEAILPWLREADGITISGGEPFDQVNALEELVRELRPRMSGDVLIFSGYPYEALETSLSRLVELVDAIVTDPFEAESPQTLTLRGSDNQRLHRLTALGRARYSDVVVDTGSPIDVMVDNDGTVWMAGIPRRGDLERLRALLESRGLDCSTSEARLPR
jgi:anaerobic ribonucleoside-triphosphate reductase activating protein